MSQLPVTDFQQTVGGKSEGENIINIAEDLKWSIRHLFLQKKNPLTFYNSGSNFPLFCSTVSLSVQATAQLKTFASIYYRKNISLFIIYIHIHQMMNK